MAWSFTAFWAEIQAVIKAAWPEIIIPADSDSPTLFTSLQAYRQQFVTMATLGQDEDSGIPPPPYCVVSFGTETPDPEFGGMAGDAVRFPAAIFYIAHSDDLGQKEIHAKLEALRDELTGNGGLFSTFQVIEEPALNSSEESPANKALAIDAQLSLISGNLTLAPGLLVART